MPHHPLIRTDEKEGNRTGYDNNWQLNKKFVGIKVQCEIEPDKIGDNKAYRNNHHIDRQNEPF